MKSENVLCNCEFNLNGSIIGNKNKNTKYAVVINEKLSKIVDTMFSRLFLLPVILLFLHRVSFVDSFIFREANNHVIKALRNDRPCNLLLDFGDVHLSAPEVIRKYGYPVERHWVTTEDGYILEMHRIPQPSVNSELNTSKVLNGSNILLNKDEKETIVQSTNSIRAVFLMHGIFGTSGDFVINCDKRAIAFQLWDNGYDVWLGNYRGNKYGRNHTILKPNTLKFWDFAIDEVGYYDLPAMVDYILNKTELKQLSIVGHSMGNAATLMMLITRPEYNEKVNIWFAMSGAVSLQDTASPPLRILATFPRTIEWIMTKFNHGELIPTVLLKLLHRFLPYVCWGEGKKIGSYHGICSIFFYILDGYDPGQIPPKMYSFLFGELPSSTSVRYFIQWIQWIISGNFSYFDFGPVKNLKKYGSVKPKLYSFKNLTTKTILMYGENDWIVSASDVIKTSNISKAALGESDPVEYFKVEYPAWNHLDFVHGKDADIYVYSYILKRLELVYKNQSNVTNNHAG